LRIHGLYKVFGKLEKVCPPGVKLAITLAIKRFTDIDPSRTGNVVGRKVLNVHCTCFKNFNEKTGRRYFMCYNFYGKTLHLKISLKYIFRIYFYQ